VSRGFDWIFWAIGALAGLCGLALLLWSLFADRPRGRRRCPKCWYDLTASPGLTCSECGHVAHHERSLRSIRRRWRWAIAALPLIAGGYLVSVTPRIGATWRWHGWRGAIPTTALLAGHRWLGEPLAGDLETRAMMGSPWGWQRAWYARIMESRYLQTRGPARGPALHNLGALGASAKGCLPTVLAAAQDADPNVRTSAAYAIGLIGSDRDRSLSMLIGLLGDESGTVRGNAAWALWLFGRAFRGDASAAVPALRESLHDESEWVRLQSAFALSWITGDPAPAVAATDAALGSTTEGLAVASAVYLMDLAAVMDVVPALCAAAEHSEPRVRRAAVMGLRQAWPRAAEAVPILVELLKDRQIDIHVEAANALAEIGPAAAQAVPALERLRYDPEPQVSEAAAAALTRIRRAP
jgi:hypothetical protein